MEQKFKEGDVVSSKISLDEKMLIHNVELNFPMEGHRSFNGYYTCKFKKNGEWQYEQFHQDSLVASENNDSSSPIHLG